MQHSEQAVAPWYKQFWPWFILSILAFAVVLGTSLLIISIKTADSLVVTNYYDAGKGINQSLERENYAKQLKIQAVVTLNSDSGQVSLQLSGASGPRQLVLALISPTLPEQDRRSVLQPQGNGLYTGLLQDAIEGRRFVELVGEEGGKEWRLFEEKILTKDQPIELNY